MTHEEEVLLHIKELVKTKDLLAIEHFVDEALAAIPRPMCACGHPQTRGITHCTDRPCYVKDFK